MKIIPSLLSISALLIFSITSCKKEGANVPNEQPAVTYQLKATNPAALINRTLAGSLVWTVAKAEANMIKFEAKKAGVEIELKSNVQRSIDLFGTTPNIGNINIPGGSYDEVEFKAFLAPASGNPALELKGTFTLSGSTVPVTFLAAEAIQIKGEKHNVVIQDAAGYNAITSINLAIATAGITASSLSNATRTNGEILITSSINANLYSAIINNLRNMHDEAEFNHH